MIVTRNDAATALHDVDSARRHSLTLFQYGLASPYLLLWGVLWIVAGAVGALSRDNAGIGWLVVDIVGFAGTGVLIAIQSRRYGEGDRRNRLFRCVATGTAVVAFVALTLSVFAPVSNVEILMLITMVVAAIYVVAGCWTGARYAVVGALLAALALGLHHLAPAHVPLMVPVLGGGALILGGLWMRSAR